MPRILFVALLMVCGCSSLLPASARRVRVSELAKLGDLRPSQPILVEFQPGDVVPLKISATGPVLQTPPDSPPVVVRVKQRFFLLLGDGPPRISWDGVHFAKRTANNSVAFGLGASANAPIDASLAVHVAGPP